MMAERKLRPSPAPVHLRNCPEDFFVVTRTCRLLTPLFGGGVRAGQPGNPHLKEPDSITPVRGTAVRGQLRFWWRAIHGALAPTCRRMRELEDALWGNASVPGRVDVQIHWLEGQPSHNEVTVFPTPSKPWEVPDGFKGVAYGAFPLTPARNATNREKAGVLHRFDGPFELLLRIDLRPRKDCPWNGRAEDIQQQVTDAVDAFTVFGGVGGRTRRGFGAIGNAGTGGPDEKMLMRRWKEVGNGGTARMDTPHVHGACLVVGMPVANAHNAWNDALRTLQEFRQGKGVGRNNGASPNRPGRSNWPEADVIRAITHMTDPNHAIPRHAPRGGTAQWLDPPVRRFPRAAFGLPIIFHFLPGDAPDLTLQIDKRRDRFPSLLHIRVSCDGKRPVALRLCGEMPTMLWSSQQQGLTHALTAEEATILGAVHPKLSTTDVLADFLTYFRERNRGELLC